MIFVLGRQRELGLAELESITGNKEITLAGECAIVDVDQPIKHERLGGTIKIGAVLGETTFGNISALSSFAIGKILSSIKEGTEKARLGISTYGIHSNQGRIISISFTVKRRLEDRGTKVKVSIPTRESALNTAQVLYNKLTEEGGNEFLIVADKGKAWIGKTVSVQDINWYSKRDYGKPKRDPKTGMLPPKLAQIMLNLAKVSDGSVVLDPFSGTGTIPMEASLMGARSIACDINYGMVGYTKENMEWLEKQRKIPHWKAYKCDAISASWDEVGHIVTEIYLGPRLHGRVKEEEVKRMKDECDTLLRKFLENVSRQIKPGKRCCIAVPIWFVNGKRIRLPTAAKLERMGFKRILFKSNGGQPLIYHREAQTVGRELLVLEKGEKQASSAHSALKPLRHPPTQNSARR